MMLDRCWRRPDGGSPVEVTGGSILVALESSGVVLCLAIVACGPQGPPGAVGPAGADALIRTREEPSGDVCPDGGLVIEYGVDLDGDRGLDDDEVTGSSVVCNGRDDDNGCSVTENEDGSATITCADGTRVSVADGVHGKPALARISEEAPGERCAFGGANVYAGIDANDDGVLQDDEVASVQTLCTGEALTGVAMVRMDPEPFGTNCPVGGTAVMSGVDTNDDGILEDGEVLQTAYVCNGPPVVVENGVLEGDYLIETSLDVALLSGVRRITGSLKLGFDAEGFVSRDAAITEISLPALEAVDGDISLFADALSVLEMPSLEAVGGRLGATAPLETVSLGGVRDVAGALVFAETHIDNFHLDSLSQGVTAITFSRNDALETIPAFEWVRTLEWLIVEENALLPQCYADRIRQQLEEDPPLVDIGGNNGEGGCL